MKLELVKEVIVNVYEIGGYEVEYDSEPNGYKDFIVKKLDRYSKLPNIYFEMKERKFKIQEDAEEVTEGYNTAVQVVEILNKEFCS